MPDPDDKILFRAFRAANIEEELAYTAVQELRNMAGQNITAALEGHKAELGAKIEGYKAELGAKIEGRFAEVSGKIDAQASEIRTTRWMMGAILALLATLTALGLLNTVLGLAGR